MASTESTDNSTEPEREPDHDAEWRAGVIRLLVTQHVEIARLHRRLDGEPDLPDTAEALRPLIDEAAEEVVDCLGVGERFPPERLAAVYIRWALPPETDDAEPAS